MLEITQIIRIDDKRNIALLDTSSISFMQGLQVKGIPSHTILKDYDLILIPEWVLAEIKDADGRADYVQSLIEQGYPIFSIAEENSWYYPQTEALTIYSQDSDTYELQRKAEVNLRDIFTSRTPVPVSYKSNDAILCQLYRENIIELECLSDFRKDIRKITYSKEQADKSIILVTELVDNNVFIRLVQDETVHIIF